MLRIIQLLKGKKAAKLRQSMACLLEKYLDADMGLADDITDRALQAHMADLKAAKERSAEDGGEIPRLKSRDRSWARPSSRWGHPPNTMGCSTEVSTRP